VITVHIKLEIVFPRSRSHIRDLSQFQRLWWQPRKIHILSTINFYRKKFLILEGIRRHIGRSARAKSNASFRSFESEKSQCSRPNLCLRTPFESRKKKKISFFSLLTERSQNEKIHYFWLFFLEKSPFQSSYHFSVQNRRRSEMSQIFLSCEILWGWAILTAYNSANDGERLLMAKLN